MRRLVAVLGLCTMLVAGCGSGKVVAPTAEKVVGTLPSAGTQAVKGDAAAGKTLFKKQGCDGCHTYKPAGSTAKVGPDLDKLTQYAQTANQDVADFARESIVNPSAYIEKGYQDVMPKTYGQTLQSKQIADLVAFLTQQK